MLPLFRVLRFFVLIAVVASTGTVYGTPLATPNPEECQRVKENLDRLKSKANRCRDRVTENFEWNRESFAQSYANGAITKEIFDELNYNNEQAKDSGRQLCVDEYKKDIEIFKMHFGKRVSDCGLEDELTLLPDFGSVGPLEKTEPGKMFNPNMLPD